MQIVDNHRGGLSRPFLGHGDIFWKSYDENQIWSKCVHARGSDAHKIVIRLAVISGTYCRLSIKIKIPPCVFDLNHSAAPLKETPVLRKQLY